MAERGKKPGVPVTENEKVAALEKQIADLTAELKEMKGKRNADPDVVDAVLTRITALEEKLQEEQKKTVKLPGGGEIALPGESAPPKPASTAAKTKKPEGSEGGNALYD